MSHSKSEKVDFHQLKYLVKTAFKLDLRSSSSMNTISTQSRKSKFPPFFTTLLVYLIMGGPLALMAYALTDSFLSMLFLVVLSMAFTAINILVEFGSVIMSPEDHNVIAPLPVNSRTYFYSKMINLLFYTSLLTLSISMASVITMAIKERSFVYLLLTFAVVLMANFAVSLAVASLYTSLLRLVSREKLSSVLNYFQLGLATMVYVGYFWLPDLIRKESARFALEPKTYFYFLPPGWYASFIGLYGAAEYPYWMLPASIGLLSLILLYGFASRYLSVGYAAAISRAEVVARKESAGSEKVNSNRRQHSGALLGFIKLLPEEQAIFRLVKAQFRYDNRLKMSILGIIPMLIIYFVLSFKETGGFPNPFDPESVKTIEFASMMVFFAVGVFPIMVQGALVYSKSYQASWVFYATPADMKALLLAVSKFIHLLFILPFNLICLVIFSFIFKNFFHAAGLIVVVYFLSLINFRLVFSLIPDLPFSRPVEKSSTMSRFWILGMFLPILIVVLPTYILMITVFSNMYAYAIALVALVILLGVVTTISRKRVERKAIQFRYFA